MPPGGSGAPGSRHGVLRCSEMSTRGGGAGEQSRGTIASAREGYADESDPDRLGHGGADARSRCLRAGAGATDAVVHPTRVDGAATGRRAPRSPGRLGEQQRHAARASARAGRQAATERRRARGAAAEGGYDVRSRGRRGVRRRPLPGAARREPPAAARRHRHLQRQLAAGSLLRAAHLAHRITGQRAAAADHARERQAACRARRRGRCGGRPAPRT